MKKPVKTKRVSVAVNADIYEQAINFLNAREINFSTWFDTCLRAFINAENSSSKHGLDSVFTFGKYLGVKVRTVIALDISYMIFISKNFPHRFEAEILDLVEDLTDAK